MTSRVSVYLRLAVRGWTVRRKCISLLQQFSLVPPLLVERKVASRLVGGWK